jgi:hypothetical protein
MGILDRLFRGSRTEKFEGKHFLSEDDKRLIKSQVRKVYENILNGYMTRAEGKEYLLKYLTSKVKRRYPGIDLDKSGLAGKINRYVSMKIRKLDEKIEHEGYLGTEVEGENGLQLGRAKRLGKLGKIKDELRRETKKRRIQDSERAESFLKAFARSKGMRVVYPEHGFRDLVEEVIDEAYDENGKLKGGRLVKGRKVLASEKKYWEGKPKKPPSDKEFEKMPKVEFVTPSDLNAFLERVVEEAKKEEVGKK